MIFKIALGGLCIIGFFQIIGSLFKLIGWLRRRLWPRPEDALDAHRARIAALQNKRSGSHGGQRFD